MEKRWPLVLYMKIAFDVGCVMNLTQIQLCKFKVIDLKNAYFLPRPYLLMENDYKLKDCLSPVNMS